MSRALTPGDPPWRPVTAFLIVHPQKGIVIFDCGLSDIVAKEGENALPFPTQLFFESRGDVNKTLISQLTSSGIAIDSISWVIVSHSHEDHIGSVQNFKSANVIVGPGGTFKTIDPAQILPLDHLRSSDTSLGSMHDVFGDSTIQIIHSGGHTPEELMLLVNLHEGPVLLTGDAVVHFDWLKSIDVERVPSNHERTAEIRDGIISLIKKNPRLVIFPGHDAPGGIDHREDIILLNRENFSIESWKSVTYKSFPNFY